MRGHRAALIDRSSLLRSTARLARALLREHGISPSEIDLMVHAGTYRQQFHTEPAFAAHLQRRLGVRCHPVGLETRQCFSLDVKDGNCAPHQAVQVIADLLPSVGGGFALLSVADYRPNRWSRWIHAPTSFVALFSPAGPGLAFAGARFDASAQDPEFRCVSSFDVAKGQNVLVEPQVNSTDIVIEGRTFSGDVAWLGGAHMAGFHGWLNGDAGVFTHRIVDRSGRVSELDWEVSDGGS